VFVPNWLGDAVMALPAVADITRSHSAEVAVVARPSVASLFALVPGGPRVIQLPRGQTEPLRREQFDAAILFPNSIHSALTAWRANIRERWGYRANCRDFLLTRRVARPPRVHQAESYQRLVAALGYPNGPLEPKLSVPAAAIDRARDALVARGWDGNAPLVAIAPGAAYGSAKRWPAESFAALARSVARDGTTVVLVGSSGDRSAADEVVERAAVHAVDLVGDTDLPMLAAVLVASRALVTNDSGAMHVAAALGVPVVAMFGPTTESETRPIGPIAPTILTHDVWCRPCMLRECPLTHRCMRGITVDMVAAALRHAL
jgi:heptosyltransferase-2